MFKITPQHIAHGLSERDYADYAGYPVKILDMAALPHGQELMRNGFLPQSKREQRIDAMQTALTSSGLTRQHGGPFTMDDAISLADIYSPTAYFSQRPVDTRADPRAHMRRLVEHGTKALDDTPMQRGIATFQLDENAEITATFRKHAAIILRPPHGLSAQEIWQPITSMPASALARPPQEPHFAALHRELHEKRHLVQLDASAKNETPRFYSELDSDLYATHVLRKNGMGSGVQAGIRHARYLGMMTLPSRYWFAKTADDIEARRNPADFGKTFLSVMEIRLRLAMAETGFQQPVAGSRALQSAIANWAQTLEAERPPGTPLPDHVPLSIRQVEKLNDTYQDLWQKVYWRQQPERLYSGLSRLQNLGLFTSQLTIRLTDKIITAAEHFSPGISTVRSAMRPGGLRL